MKLKLLLLPILTLSVSSMLISQNLSETPTQTRKNYFYVGPVDLFINTMQLGYERKLTNHNTLAFFGGFKLSKKQESIDRVGGNGEIQYRINLLYDKEGASKMIKNHSAFAYFAPFIQYKYEEATDDLVIPGIEASTRNTVTSYINSGFGGLGFGIRLSGLQNRFCLNLFAGGGMKYSQVKGDKKYEEFMQPGYTGIAPKVEFHMGIAF